LTTTAIAGKLAGRFGIGIAAARKITNVNLKRLADKGELVRVQKGIYSRAKDTPFGKLTPDEDDVLTAVLLREGGKAIGYIAGPSLLNALGLCSWLPGERHIATNLYRHRLPKGTHICLHKPADFVDEQNAPYLRALEIFSAMEKYPVDAEKPEDILREALKKDGIDNEKLIWYARCHFGQKLLRKTIDVALRGVVQ
ncbi:MAG: type IV toxin-antitoxin system AbiEi family antitoxin domain-containing protein, partial [Lachnospiraceae bacterium]|nr:type IV toxin-antitoxin system AbiEi family antitoxin domain-containing protein [Lachnospiraceae bacterium]